MRKTHPTLGALEFKIQNLTFKISKIYMKKVKADFAKIYSQYSPTEYIKYIVGELNYLLPFQAMDIFRPYQDRLLSDKPIRITVVGSGHGLDVVSLRFQMTPQEILERWGTSDTAGLPFSPFPEQVITIIDIEQEPLRFARDVNLCDNSLLANMCEPYSLELERHFREMTDVVVAVGVTSYIGPEGIGSIIRSAFVNGKALILCFSVVKYLDVEEFISTCMENGLKVKKIGNNILQRNYADNEEKGNIHSILKQKGCLADEDNTGLRSHLFIAYKAGTVFDNE